jgi:hypothetical protein
VRTPPTFPHSKPDMADLSTQVSLEFLQWQSLYEIERPFQILINIPIDAEDQRTDNLVFHRVPVSVHNVRANLTTFNIDECGFKYVHHQSRVGDLSDRESITSEYLPECEAFLKEHLSDVDEVFFFDWRVCLRADILS